MPTRLSPGTLQGMEAIQGGALPTVPALLLPTPCWASEATFSLGHFWVLLPSSGIVGTCLFILSNSPQAQSPTTPMKPILKPRSPQHFAYSSPPQPSVSAPEGDLWDARDSACSLSTQGLPRSKCSVECRLSGQKSLDDGRTLNGSEWD